MTKQEWLIHILNGGKGTSNFTDEGVYIEFKDDEFYYNAGNIADLHFHTENFAKYFEYPIYAKHKTHSYNILVKFTTLNNAIIINANNNSIIGDNFNTNAHTADVWEILPDYEEVIKKPKKMIKVAPYVYKYNTGKVNHYVQTTSYYKDDGDFKKAFNNTDVKFKRLTALEIEVEDYEQN